MALRVMTYNILKGGIGRESYIEEVIRAVKPNVVVLQEVTELGILKSLAQSLGMQWFFGKGNKKTKVALLSQLPIVNFRSHHPRFPIWHNFVEAEVRYQPNKSFRLVGVHLIANLWFGFELWRYWEVKYILDHYKRFSAKPCLITGDFNAIAPQDAVIRQTMPISLKAMLLLQGNRTFRLSIQSLLSAGLIDSFRIRNPGDNGFTLPPPEPNTRLDYIFVNRAMEKHLTNCRVVREPDAVLHASDHYPVVAEFDLDI